MNNKKLKNWRSIKDRWPALEIPEVDWLKKVPNIICATAFKHSIRAMRTQVYGVSISSPIK
jgi:hypothetical protein